ncbi:hypothetical protein JKP88DRAFT_219623 [Tribonema minus]|uniref:Uncharacterized protein n=1 Tax=Tribonema minus TaxID=303371 RepID=A0A836CG48_9STRA|nr:hypothetical protein JKP88DRAFT_219623 [Tribonema minus]
MALRCSRRLPSYHSLGMQLMRQCQHARSGPDCKLVGLQAMAARHSSNTSGSGGLPKVAPHHAKRELLFTCDAKTKFRFMGAGSIAHAGYWVWYNSSFTQALKEFSIEPVLGGVGLGVSVILLMLARAYAGKYVASLSYVEALNSFEVISHTFFGEKGPPRLLRLASIVSVTKAGEGQYFALKIKEDNMFTLLDQEKGTFVDKTRLEQLIEHKGPPPVVKPPRPPARGPPRGPQRGWHAVRPRK